MKQKCILAAILCFCTALTSCGSFSAGKHAKEGTYADFSVAEFCKITTVIPHAIHTAGQTIKAPAAEENSNHNGENKPFRMKVYESMDLYSYIGDDAPVQTLAAGTVIDLLEIPSSEWAQIYDTATGAMLGFAKDGFLHSIDADLEVYAELPVEYGMAKNNDKVYVKAYSHLVDIRKYLKTYSSTEESNDGVTLSDYDVKVSMKLSTPETSISEPFYDGNICMVQYDILPRLKKAIELFREDGYMIVIYDAYRPTSVQQRWFDVVRVHKWVADPSIGMGGIHDRGTALDISLIDIETGKELEMPTPMHTFTEESARDSESMTDTARENMDYMKRIMVSCGFTFITSEWWHFQTLDTENYLPTDHPIDSIPLVPCERAS